MRLVYYMYCRYKADKWWMQSFLAGIERILVGYRTDDGCTFAPHRPTRFVIANVNVQVRMRCILPLSRSPRR